MPVALRQAPEGGETFEHARLRREEPDNKAYWHAAKWAEYMEGK